MPVLRDKVGPLCARCEKRSNPLFSVRKDEINIAVDWLIQCQNLSSRVAEQLRAVLNSASLDCRRKLCSEHHFRLARDPNMARYFLQDHAEKSARRRNRAAARASAAGLQWVPFSNLQELFHDCLHVIDAGILEPRSVLSSGTASSSLSDECVDDEPSQDAPCELQIPYEPLKRLLQFVLRDP